MAQATYVGAHMVVLPSGLTDALFSFQHAIESSTRSSRNGAANSADMIGPRDALIAEIGHFAQALLIERWPTDRAALASTRLRAALINQAEQVSAALRILDGLPGLPEPTTNTPGAGHGQGT